MLLALPWEKGWAVIGQNIHQRVFPCILVNNGIIQLGIRGYPLSLAFFLPLHSILDFANPSTNPPGPTSGICKHVYIFRIFPYLYLSVTITSL